MYIHRYERRRLIFGFAMLILFAGTIIFAAFADDINPPGDTQAIDPAKVASTPPFDRHERDEVFHDVNATRPTPDLLHRPGYIVSGMRAW